MVRIIAQRLAATSLALAFVSTVNTPAMAQQFSPGSRTVMDAHNCYPYFEWWGDRIDRALSAGTPLAIEQDLAWHTDAKTGKSWSVVTHGEPTTGEEPIMEHYFFDKVRPVVEKALHDGNHGDWPLITLNLDFKDNKPDIIIILPWNFKKEIIEKLAFTKEWGAKLITYIPEIEIH